MARGGLNRPLAWRLAEPEFWAKRDCLWTPADWHGSAAVDWLMPALALGCRCRPARLPKFLARGLRPYLSGTRMLR